MKKALCAFFCLALASPIAAAQDIHSANYLLEGCRIVASGATPPDGQMFRATMCMGKLEAVVFFASSIDTPNRSCPPRGVPDSQVAKVVVAYLDQNPARLHQVFLGLAYEAVAKAWPCPAQ
ncbi:hypothetical protein SAMN05444161_5589 [Rhizobiales bacterium GAS191]|nr:hypothetical protein SAMN05444161_5589 [Rhizobiales bacterium GAS191]